MNKKIVEVTTRILSKNDIEASKLREFYKVNNIFTINLMSSPGSGKTTLLETIAENQMLNFSVVEGDLQTNRDADRLKRFGINAHQITTGDACHLEAKMVQESIEQLQKIGKIQEFLYKVSSQTGIQNHSCLSKVMLGL